MITAEQELELSGILTKYGYERLITNNDSFIFKKIIENITTQIAITWAPNGSVGVLLSATAVYEAPSGVFGTLELYYDYISYASINSFIYSIGIEIEKIKLTIKKHTINTIYNANKVLEWLGEKQEPILINKQDNGIDI